jgi:hypothetical protein
VIVALLSSGCSGSGFEFLPLGSGQNLVTAAVFGLEAGIVQLDGALLAGVGALFARCSQDLRFEATRFGQSLLSES